MTVNKNRLKGRPNILDRALSHMDDRAAVVLDSNGNITNYNEVFLDLFDFSEEDLYNKPLPVFLQKLHDESTDSIVYTNKYGEKVQISYLISHLKESDGVSFDLITYKDLSQSLTRSRFKNAMINIAQLVNSSEDIESMSASILDEIRAISNYPAAFICLFDTVNRNFYINFERGLNESYKCHSCNYCQSENTVAENKKSCFNSYTNLTINHERLSHHAISKYFNAETNLLENYAIIHIPLVSDSVLMGLLHIIAPMSNIKKLLYEKDFLNLIGNEITVGIRRIRLVLEIKQYADNLERVIKLRTDQLREKDAQLIQSGKLATLGELATGIAHEINQPLGGISLITQGLIMAKARNKLDDVLLIEKLNQIVEQVDRINNIITHLRTFARQTDNFKVEVDVRKPLLDVFKLIGQQLVNKEIEVILDIDEEIPIILAEHNRLEQIFLNIIGNARDALEDMEKIVAQMTKENQLPLHLNRWKKRIVIRAFADNEKLFLEFIDNGTGIPHAVINKIFDPFFTTKEVGRGTGLGLSITYGIVRDFGGMIEIESDELKGCKFILKFPLYHK